MKLALLVVALLTVGVVDRAVWRWQMGVTGIAGDSLQYYRLAHSLAKTRTLSFDGKTPAWTRLPGYPVLLWALQLPDDEHGFGRWFARVQWLNLALDLTLAALVVLLSRALGAGRWAWAGGVAWVLQPWGSVFAVYPLSDVSAAFFTVACLAALVWATAGQGWGRFVVAGALAAAAQYLRGDAVLLVPLLIGGALAVKHWRGAAAALVTYVVLFLPWPVRNFIQFGEPHLLGGGNHIDVHGGSFDRTPVVDWMRTWAASERATVEVGWKFPFHPLSLAELPPEAVDGPDESAQLGAILKRYNTLGARLDNRLRAQLSSLAQARARRHPLLTWVSLPATRMALMLLPPRDGFGLGSPLGWERPIFIVGDALVVAAALAGLWTLRRQRVALLLGAFLVLRLAVMGWTPTPEPRYFYPALPVLFAFAAALPATWRRA